MIVQDKIISSSNEKLQIRGSFFLYEARKTNEFVFPLEQHQTQILTLNFPVSVSPSFLFYFLDM